VEKEMNMRLIIRSVLVGAIVVCATASTRADVKLNSLFTDNMVLQRDIPAKVFGTADDGERVIVSINGQTAKTTAKGGEWLVELKPMKAGGPHRLTIEGKNTLTLQNVVFGDVWLCTGQSNMDFDCAWFASPEKRQDEYLDEYGVYRKKYIEITRTQQVTKI
jgi:sialate O-acetylesterase